MSQILTALFLGIAAGAIDTAPMWKTKVPRASILSILAQWMLLGLVIPFVSWGIPPWQKGLILGLLGMLPTMIQLSLRNPKAIVPTGIAGAVLGCGIAVAADFLI